MRMRALSPIVAVLVLILAALAAGYFIWTYMMSMMPQSKPFEATLQKIQVAGYGKAGGVSGVLYETHITVTSHSSLPANITKIKFVCFDETGEQVDTGYIFDGGVKSTSEAAGVSIEPEPKELTIGKTTKTIDIYFTFVAKKVFTRCQAVLELLTPDGNAHTVVSSFVDVIR